MKKILVCLVVCFIISAGITNYSEGKTMEKMNKTKEEAIFETGEIAEQNFTGKVFVKMLITNPIYDCLIYNVTFDPGARNNWHKHSIGQILLVTYGEGYYQEEGKAAQLLHKGDVVEIPAKVKHWHGASTTSKFVHIGITPKSQNNEVEWLEPLSDEEYSKL